jgi:hypothetical protein
MSASIDDFLDVHAADENIQMVGMIAIAKSIIGSGAQQQALLRSV